MDTPIYSKIQQEKLDNDYCVQNQRNGCSFGNKVDALTDYPRLVDFFWHGSEKGSMRSSFGKHAFTKGVRYRQKEALMSS